MSILNHRVLVVDDNRAIHGDFRKILSPKKRMLEDEIDIFGEAPASKAEPAFELDFASQGEEALQMVSAARRDGKPYAMAFIDVRMPPGWDGIETTVQIWKVDARLQVVICTAYSDYSWSQLSDRLDSPDKLVILKKPFDVVEVLQLANALTTKWQLLEDVEERTIRLEESERRFRFLAETIPGFVWTAQPDGPLDYINQRFQEFSGRSFEQNKGWGWEDILHPADLPLCVERWTESLRTGLPYQNEFRLKGADSTYRWYLSRAVPMRNDGGEIVRWVGTSIDIEDQKRAEEALRLAGQELEGRVSERTEDLRQKSMLLEAQLNSSPDGILVVDNAGRQILQNKRVAELWKIPREIADDPDDRKQIEYVCNHTQNPEQFVEKVNYLYAHPDEVSVDEIELKDGTVLDRYSSPVKGADRKFYGRIWTFRDITDRKQAERALSYERELLRTMLDHSPDSIYFKDLDSRFVRCSKAFEKLFHVSDAGSLVGRTDFDFFTEEHAAPAFADEQEIIRSGKAIVGKLEKETHKDGRITWCLTNKMPWRDPSGNIIGTFGNSKDVTAIKEAEAELAAERELFRTLLENVPDFIYFKDLQGRFTRVNRAQAKCLGLNDPQEAIGKRDADFFAGLFSRQTLVDEVRLFTTGESLLDKEEEIQTVSGTIWVSATKVPIRDQQGHITGLVGLSRNITERKRVEEELRTQRESFRALTENAPDGIVRIDHNLRFVYVNRVVEEILGVPAASFLGRTYAELGLGSRDDWSRATELVFETGQDTTFEFQISSGSEPRYFETRLVPEHSTAGKVLYVLGLTRDVTEQKKAEKDRQLMEVQLRQAQKLESIGQLAAGIAHEINTPTQYVGDNTRFLKESFDSMTKVLHGYQEMLQAAKANALTPELLAQVDQLLAESDLTYLFEQIPAAIKETLEGVERVTKIVRAMKEFSHPGGKEKSAADLNRAIESTVTVARNEWKYLAELELNLDRSLPPVPCFIGEFNQVILNLVVNAAQAIGERIKAQPGPKGKISVSTHRDGEVVEIRVTDTGTGIPEALRPRIFTPFFTTKEVGKGTGQGLSLVYGSIVKKHGGTVNFESEVGKGTTFILRLPIASSPSQPKLTGPDMLQIAPARPVETHA